MIADAGKRTGRAIWRRSTPKRSTSLGTNAADLTDLLSAPGVFALIDPQAQGFILVRVVLDEAEVLTLAVAPVCAAEGRWAAVWWRTGGGHSGLTRRRDACSWRWRPTTAAPSPSTPPKAFNPWQGAAPATTARKDGAAVDALVLSKRLASSRLTAPGVRPILKPSKGALRGPHRKPLRRKRHAHDRSAPGGGPRAVAGARPPGCGGALPPRP